MSALAHVDALERALVAKGFPRMSPWWRATLERFYRSGRRQCVLRCGRRAGKSSTLCRVAVLEALFGEHVIPPGDVGVVAVVSVSRDEAAQRLRTIRAILDALGIAHRPIDGGIELTGRPVVVKVYAASVAGVSGFTCICAICDETAKWRDSDSGANPATEVLASLRPTMATQPRARIFLSSSPVGTEDAHARAFDQGDGDFQTVAEAPTWIANPSVTEEETHRLEPDPRIWAREYAAIPQAGLLGVFDVDDVGAAFEPRAGGTPVGPRVCVIDASSGRVDRFTYAICGFVLGPTVVAASSAPAPEPTESESLERFIESLSSSASGREVLSFDVVDGFDAAAARRLGSAGVVAKVARVARTHGARVVHADQREAFALASLFRAEKLRFHEHPWTATSKPAAIEVLRRMFRERAISLPVHEGLRRELLAFEERIAPSGAFTFGARGNGHDDYVSLLVTAAMASIDGGLRSGTQRTAGATQAGTLVTYRSPMNF